MAQLRVIVDNNGTLREIAGGDTILPSTLGTGTANDTTVLNGAGQFVSIASLNYWTKVNNDLYYTPTNSGGVYVNWLEATNSIAVYNPISNSTASLAIAANNTGFVFRTYNLNPRLELFNNDNFVFTAYYNGNVRIGTGTDSGFGRLQVAGAINQTSVTNSLLFANTNGTLVAATGANIATALGSAASANYIQNQNSTAQPASSWINGSARSASVITRNSLNGGYATLVAGSDTTTGYLEIRKADTTRLGYIGFNNTVLTYVAQNEAYHLFTGGNVVVNNNLGIGTTNPTSDLHLGGVAKDRTIHISTGSGALNSARLLLGTPNREWELKTLPLASSRYDIILNYTASTFAGSIGFENNGNRLITISSAGNLFIGGTSMTSPININKGIFLQSQENNIIGYNLYTNDGTNNRRIAFYLDSINAEFGIRSTQSTGGNGTYRIITAGVNRFSIFPNGNIGVATDSDNGFGRLQVTGTIQSSDLTGTETLLKTNTTGGIVRASATDITNLLGDGNYILNQNASAQTGNAWVSGQLRAGNIIGGLGSAAAPSFSFVGDLNTGIYSPSADAVSIATAGVQRLTVNNVGNVGIGTTGLIGFNFRINKNITGATTSYGIVSQGQIQNDVTSNAFINYSSASTQAEVFTLTNLSLFYAIQGTFGAGSTVTNQYGFFATSSLTGAVSNYGFRGAIPEGLNRWNLYMDGTARNYIAGKLSIGVGTQSNDYGTFILQVLGTSYFRASTTNGEGVRITDSGGVDNMRLHNYGIQFDRSLNYLRPTTNNNKNLYIGDGTTSLRWSTLFLDAANIRLLSQANFTVLKTAADGSIQQATASDISTLLNATNSGGGDYIRNNNTTTAQAAAFRISGNGFANVFWGNQNVVSDSDLRLKTNIEDYYGIYDKLKKINLKSYVKHGNHEVGYIAQEMQKIFPFLVKENEHTKLLGIDYGHVGALALQLGKENGNEIEALKRKIKELEKEIQTLKNK